jgi:hypothetical protein
MTVSLNTVANTDDEGQKSSLYNIIKKLSKERSHEGPGNGPP